MSYRKAHKGRHAEIRGLSHYCPPPPPSQLTSLSHYYSQLIPPPPHNALRDAPIEMKRKLCRCTSAVRGLCFNHRNPNRSKRAQLHSNKSKKNIRNATNAEIGKYSNRIWSKNGLRKLKKLLQI